MDVPLLRWVRDYAEVEESRSLVHARKIIRGLLDLQFGHSISEDFKKS